MFRNHFRSNISPLTSGQGIYEGEEMKRKWTNAERKKLNQTHATTCAQFLPGCLIHAELEVRKFVPKNSERKVESGLWGFQWSYLDVQFRSVDSSGKTTAVRWLKAPFIFLSEFLSLGGLFCFTYHRVDSLIGKHQEHPLLQNPSAA